MQGRCTAAQLRQAYLDKGSDSVQIFTPHRIENAEEMAASVVKDRARYAYTIAKCMPTVDS